METISYLGEHGDLEESKKDRIPSKCIVEAYKTMVLTRLVDERMFTLQRQGTITFAMSALGEEACAVASAAALEDNDWMYPQYRESGIMFWRGYTIQEYLHGMFCNSDDIILGRQMPNHFGSKKLNVVTVSSPIGTQIPQAAGCAYAMKLQKEKAVSICYFGDGTTSEGDFHVGINFAAVRKAPCIFFCRNNGYAISTPTERQFASDGIAPKGPGYGVTTFRVDGNDFFAIYECVRQARELCLKGEGPVLIEAMTYRSGPHSTSDDPSAYREDKEVDAWKKQCPIKRLRRYLEKEDLWDANQENAFIKEIKETIDMAIQTAKKSPPPPIDSLIEDVYFEVPDALKEQLNDVKRFIPGSESL